MANTKISLRVFRDKPRMLVTALLLSRLIFSQGIYTSEPSVKLLSVDFFAKRFPAIESEFRVDLAGGEVSITISIALYYISLLSGLGNRRSKQKSKYSEIIYLGDPLQALVVLDYRRGNMSQSLVINLGFPTLPHKK